MSHPSCQKRIDTIENALDNQEISFATYMVLQLRLEGGWTTKIKNEYKCFDNEHVDYEHVKEAGGEILEKEKRWL